MTDKIPPKPEDPDGNGDYETAWLYEHAVAKVAVEALELYRGQIANDGKSGYAEEALRQIEESGWRSENGQ